MPLTDELGSEAVGRMSTPLGILPKRFTQGTFEEWLSRLAEDQPDLDESENLRRRASFLDLSQAIGEILQERQREVWSAQPPQFRDLSRLVATLHAFRDTVISFNYDTLVEQAVDEHDLRDATGTKVTHSSVIDQMPPPPPGNARWGEAFTQSFHLLKLHGSLNWWWVPGDATGSTINRWITTELDPAGLSGHDRELPGRSRFIVPPSSLKSGFYANPFTRQLWQRAAGAVSEANECYFVGYSLPRTDLVTVGMLRERLRPDVRLVVVNPDPRSVCEQLARMGLDDDNIEVIDGLDCVARFTDELEGAASTALATRLATLPSSDAGLVAVTWGLEFAAPVTAVVSEGRALVVDCLLPGKVTDRLGVHNQAMPATVSDLEFLAEVQQRRPHRMEARFPDGRRAVLISTALLHRETGAAPVWRCLNPSEPARWFGIN